MEYVEQRPNSKINTVEKYFPSFKRKMKVYDGGFMHVKYGGDHQPCKNGHN